MIRAGLSMLDGMPGYPRWDAEQKTGGTLSCASLRSKRVLALAGRHYRCPRTNEANPKPTRSRCSFRTVRPFVLGALSAPITINAGFRRIVQSEAGLSARALGSKRARQLFVSGGWRRFRAL